MSTRIFKRDLLLYLELSFTKLLGCRVLFLTRDVQSLTNLFTSTRQEG